MKNSEFSKLYDYLLVYYKRGLDAVIVQDIGVVKAIHEYFPSMEIHTSTQMTVTGADGVRFSFTVWSDACGHGKGGFSCRDEAHT